MRGIRAPAHAKWRPENLRYKGLAWPEGLRCRAMLNAARYYWIIAKGYRLRPWDSPYIQWRLETYFGKEAAELDRAKFLRLMWRARARTRTFLDWVGERRRAQSS